MQSKVPELTATRPTGFTREGCAPSQPLFAAIGGAAGAASSSEAKPLTVQSHSRGAPLAWRSAPTAQL